MDSSAAPLCDASISFDFETDAECQDLVDKNCCIFESQCAANTDCVRWLDCVNACPKPRAGSCVSSCGNTRDASFFNALTGLNSCRDAFDGGRTCIFP